MMNNEEQQNQQQPQSGENQQEQQNNQEQGSQVTFTDEQQAAINNMISTAIGKERSKADDRIKAIQDQAAQDKQDAIQKAEARAKMTADERAKAEQQDREKELAKQREDLDRKMREFSTKNMLLDKGISVDLMPLVMGTDDDETSQRLDLLKKYRDKEVQAATQKLMAGNRTPSTGNGGNNSVGSGDNPWTEGAWNLTKQQQIYTTNPEQARQMIAQAQPKRAFFVGKN
ncbi:DUF4355 domain-containing protein [Limosilactobacillus oris]